MLARLLTAVAAALAAACLTVVPATAGVEGACGPSGYAYAGVQSMDNGHGVAARLTSLAIPAVQSGHVAGWVGVGAPGEGPGGSDEWIQVGLNSLPGTGNTLYYEVTRPYAGTQYVEVARDVPAGKRLRIAVLEVRNLRDHWRVWVDGRPVSPAIHLVGSHRRLTPMAMAESWDGGRPACNRYAYKFDDVALAMSPGGSWKVVRETAVLQDPGYRVARHTAGSFTASATRPLPATAPPRAPEPAAASVSPGVQVYKAKLVEERVVVKHEAPVRKGQLPPAAEQPAEPAVPIATVAPVASEPAPATVAPETTVVLPEPVEGPYGLDGFLHVAELSA